MGTPAEREQHHTHVGKYGSHENPFFVAKCSCGWESRVTATRKEAENEATDHVCAISDR